MKMEATPAQAMIDFLRDRILQDPATAISENTPLISSGLVDSFSVMEILLQLESITNRKIPAGEVTPNDLDTVEQMLLTAQRVGRAR